MNGLFGLTGVELVAIAGVSALAFLVRGLSGFGSSMVGIGGLSLLLPPARVVPAYLALELLTTAHLLPGVWRQVDWRSLRPLLVGAALATPLGMLLLTGVPADAMRLGVSAVLLAVALAMLSGLAQRLTPAHTPGTAGALGAGLASGLLNGAAGIGGPPVIVFYFATTAAAVSRASLIAYFLATDVWALAWAGGQGLLTRDAGPVVAVALPFALAGVAAGLRLYRRLDEAQMRRLVWGLLAGLGTLGVANAAWRLGG